MTDLSATWDVISTLLVIGLMIGFVSAVVAGSIRIGWNLAPWIVICALLVWIF